MLIVYTLFFLILNRFLYYQATSSSSFKYRLKIVVRFLIVYIFLNLSYEYIYVKGVFLNRMKFLVLFVFSISPLIMFLMHQRNLYRMHKRLEKDILSNFPKINYLLVLYIITSIIQIFFLWSDIQL